MTRHILVLGFVLYGAAACQPDRARVELPTNPPVSGACCDLTNGACLILTSPDCTQRPGSYAYLGDATVCDPNPCSAPPAEDFTATGQIRTFEEGEIKTASGAIIAVPKHAVPLTPVGEEGKVTFSIEKDDAVSPNPPSGKTPVSDVYRFGPDGITFTRPLKVTLPVLGDTTNKLLTLYRINQTTGKSEPMGGVFDRATKSISTQTYKFSPWFCAGAPVSEVAWGALDVSNASADHWLNLCLVAYILEHPDADADFTGEAWSTWAPAGEIGVSRRGLWFLPQGTYRLCVEMRRAGTLSTPPGPPRHIEVIDVVIDQPWTRASPVAVPIEYAALPAEAQDGPCSCTPRPTPSVGTGEVQVTLTWHSAAPIDLDLYVTEPNGDICYYAEPETSTGGSLDIDNKCADYVDGRPENIYWANAPIGEYKVEVDWFSDCGTGAASIGFDVRVVNGGASRTLTGTLSADARVEVTRFTVTGSGLRGGDPILRSVPQSGSGSVRRVPKE